MKPEDFVNDIPYTLAQAAHSGTSFVPERRAEQERAGYASQLAADYEELSRYATTDEKRAILDEEFARYRAGYRQRYVAMLSARSRCMSTMITGGSNFPTRRNAKRNATADKRIDEVGDYRDFMFARIKRELRPELRPIMSGDADATKRLADKLAKLEILQAYMKAANAAIRKYEKEGPDVQVAAIMAIPANDKGEGVAESTARKLLEKDFAGRIGFADYMLKNNGAEIRRLQKRLASVTESQAAPIEAVVGTNAVLEDCPAENRVRLFYPGKPDKEVRERLKGAGFRWAPSIGSTTSPAVGCWQAYRNHRSIACAKREAGQEQPRVACEVCTDGSCMLCDDNGTLPAGGDDVEAV